MPERNITTENWASPPQNRKSFQQVQSLFPTRRLKRGPGPITQLNRQTQELLALPYNAYSGQRSLQQMLDNTYTDAFLVMKDGSVITELYFNDMAADSHHLLNSVSKSFVGMLVGILVDQGMLDTQAKLTRYLPEFSDTAFVDTTIRHCLDMTAAVRYTEDYEDEQADFWKETAVVGWRPKLVNRHSPITLFQFASSLNQKAQLDGQQYHYRTVLTNVLAMAAERATGISIGDLLEQRIWQKLGAEQDAAIVVDSIGFPYLGAGMSVCARDLARFGQMILGNGFFNGQQVVPATWIEDTRHADKNGKQLFADSNYAPMLPGGHYRNQVWVGDSDQGILMCIGIHGQTIHINMTTGVVIVKLSSHPKPDDNFIFNDTFRALNDLSRLL
ncbi:MAG: serine hydrolase [Gammaproteobacteria bacterium]|mgnify:FL=1|nr:serine hydrolase [Gammaproteobacteria bacterium]MBT5205458.1 serine hydrolase [Gammaproteobacteria bacterium]MBT5600767.1 serine hydrolase [Gammaproteobacteria bacterium]